MGRSSVALVGRRGGEPFWRELIRKWETGNLTQAEFCRREGVSIWTFRGWLYGRKRPAPPSRAIVPAFLPVRVAAPAAELVEILLRSGRVIRFRGDFDPEVLRKLIPVLEDATC